MPILNSLSLNSLSLNSPPIPLECPEFIECYPKHQSSYLQHYELDKQTKMLGCFSDPEVLVGSPAEALSKKLPLFAVIRFNREMNLPEYKFQPLNANGFNRGKQFRKFNEKTSVTTLYCVDTDAKKITYYREGLLRSGIFVKKMAIDRFSNCIPEMCGWWSCIFEMVSDADLFLLQLVALHSTSPVCLYCNAKQVGNAPKPALEVYTSTLFKKCAWCKTVYYCNQECEDLDREAHDLVCRPRIQFDNDVSTYSTNSNESGKLRNWKKRLSMNFFQSF